MSQSVFPPPYREHGSLIGLGDNDHPQYAIGNADKVVIGNNATGDGTAQVVIGRNAYADSDSATAVAIGDSATVQAADGIAIGREALAQYSSSIALGADSYAGATSAIALGLGASAEYARSVAMGPGAEATAANQIMLGTAVDTVVFPGGLTIPTAAATGRVLTSDATGKATWQAASGGGLDPMYLWAVVAP